MHLLDINCVKYSEDLREGICAATYTLFVECEVYYILHAPLLQCLTFIVMMWRTNCLKCHINILGYFSRVDGHEMLSCLYYV